MTAPRPHLSHPKYRADIDGLRAVAVIAVVVFHAFPSALGGGFTGVDVFFVISGFLISTIIFGSLERGTFSFAEFYARRVRRIFPALLVVVAAVYVFGWFALVDAEYKQLGKHVAGAAGFAANVVFWRQAGYFDNAAVTKPLLHLWSLGIEEQFYLFWPLLAWTVGKRPRHLLVLTVLAAAVSFGVNAATVRTHAVAAFYLPHTRIWELLCGSVLAWLVLGESARPMPWLRSPRSASAHIASIAGMGLLAFGFWWIDQELPFPGGWALVPVAGTMLLIAAGPSAVVNRTLCSWRPMVWIGLISYPLYLWHWPLLSFARIIEGGEPGAAFRAAAAIASVGLAWMTYASIERPVRFGRYARLVVAPLAAAMLAVGVAGYTTYARDGLEFRANAHFRQFTGDVGHLTFHKYVADHFYPCTAEAVAAQADTWEGFARCNQSKPGTDVDVALVGDSHAEHLFIGLAEAMPDKNVAFYIKSSPPFMKNPEFTRIYDTVLPSHSIRTVIYTMFWDRRATQLPEGSTLEREVGNVLDALISSGKRVFLTEDVPSFPFPPEKCVIRPLFADLSRSCSVPAESVKPQTDAYAGAIDRILSTRPSVHFFRTHQYLCDEAACGMTQGDTILYRDDNHLNIVGSRLVGRKLVDDHPELAQ